MKERKVHGLNSELTQLNNELALKDTEVASQQQSARHVQDKNKALNREVSIVLCGSFAWVVGEEVEHCMSVVIYGTFAVGEG